jgi:hypothetical protein
MNPSCDICFIMESKAQRFFEASWDSARIIIFTSRDALRQATPFP